MMNPRIFWIAMLLFVLAGCQTTSPMEQAFMDMNREEVFHQIQSSPDPQSARDQALVRSVYWTRVREPHRSFHTALSKELVRSGANVHADPHGMALSAAGSPYAIDLLHELGFNLSTQDPGDGSTLLGYAALFAQVESVQKLIAYKVDLEPVDRGTGRTPLSVAMTHWLQLPYEPGQFASQVIESQRQEISNGEQIAKMLVRAGANVNAKAQPSGQTPLMLAALKNRPDVVRYLLSVGADPSLKDADGDTAQTYAELGRQQAAGREEARRADLERQRETSDAIGKMVKSVGAAAVISRTHMSADSKANVMGAVTSDIVTDGKANATASLLGGQAPASATVRAGTNNAQASAVARRPTAAQTPSWKACGPEQWCSAGDGLAQFCSGPPTGKRCKSECSMTSGVIYHDTQLPKNAAYVPSGEKCDYACDVRNACN